MTIDTMRSSRLIVKNLPNSVTQEKLKDHFSAKGIVTDVKLKNTPDGKFRHFAFVGFKTEEEAEEAQQYFDKTFVGASRITVELCHNLGEKPKSQSKKVRDRQKAELLRQKAKEKEEAPKADKRTTKEDEILEKYGEDPAFMEFLQAHKKSTTTWGNDTLVDELKKLQDKKKKKRKHDEDEEEDEDECEVEGGEEDTAPTKKKSKKAAVVEGTTKDTKKPDVEFFTLKLRDVPKKARKKDVKGFFAPLKLKSIRFPKGVRGIVYVGFATEADRIKGLQRNKSFLLGNQIRLNIYSSKDDGDATPKGKWQTLTDDLEKNTEPVGESGRIFLRNLPYTTNEDEVTKLFEEFGPVTEVHLPIDKISRKLKGIGFVSFMLPEHADKAFGALDGTVFQGRMLHLLPAKSKEELTGDETNAGSSFKTEKEHKQKKSAGSSHNWNALFLGPSAVAKVISEKYGISREEMLLDKNDDEDGKLASVGVRMALAETEIVTDTKKFLEQHGVCLEAFDSTDKKLERSKTVMLVKNLPAGTTSDDIKNVFVKHGVLNRIILPSSGITAIVEFAEPAEARAAFKKLAYSKFYNLPLYLEWAPQGVFLRPADAKDIIKREPEEVAKATTAEESPQPQAKQASQILQSAQFEPVDENAVPELDTTLFVKNLNFRTVEELLKKHFLQCGPVFAVTVARKKDPSNPEVLLSMGYGFVQFYRTKDAGTALTTLNGTMLENHILELKRSTRTLAKTSTEATKKKGNGTKLLVRNVPFQATQEEITDLFTTFGKIKAVRLPRKMTGNGEHRGFGFIEYYSESDALKAYDTLCKSTHLYGRRLVLEWASQDESIEDLRAKTARLARAANDGEDQSSLGSTKKNLQRYFKSQTATSATKDDEDENDE